MPQYHDAMLDHVGVGVKNVFWPDQVITPSRPPRARAHRARSLLASLKRHRAIYTVSPPSSTTYTPPTTTSCSREQQQERHLLARSRSYTESHAVSPSTWSRTSSPTWSARSLSSLASQSMTPTPSCVDLAAPSPSPCVTPHPSYSPTPTPPTTPVSLPRNSRGHGCCRGNSPPLNPHCLPPTRPSPRAGGWASAPGSPTELSRGWPPAASRRPPRVVEGTEGEVGGGEAECEKWVLCTLARPASRNRRIQKMNQMSMAKNTEQYHQWLQDTPKPNKGGRANLLGRALSFKDRLEGKFTGMKSPMRPNTGKIVKVEPSGNNETLHNKVEHVWRALDFYKDVVDKSSTDMLPGSATVVLEMVVALNLALKPAFSNQSSNAVASVLASVHQSVAELVRWSDQLLLHEDDSHNTKTVDEVVLAVREAVQALVDLAADKENFYTPDSSIIPSSVDNNNSIEKSPAYCSNRHSDISSHRNSLPEIKADSPTEKNGSFLLPCDNSTKLSHSRSSDSILTGSEVESPPPKPPLPFGRSDVAPPLPPKKKSTKGSSPENYAANAKYLPSPVGHSPHLNHSHDGSSSEWADHNIGSSSLSTSLERGSGTTRFPIHVSPASSLDCMNQPHDEPPTSRTSLNSCSSLPDRPDLDFESAVHKNLRIEIPGPGDTILPISQRMPSVYNLGTNQGFRSISSMQSISSSTSTSSISHGYSSKFTSESTAVMQSRSQTSFSSSQGENHLISVQVRPALPAKQRQYHGGGSSEGRATSTYDNVDRVDGADIRYISGDPSPKLPPKANNVDLGSSSSSSTSSVNSTSTFSIISNSSSISSQGGSCVQFRQKNKLDIYGSDDNPPPLPVKKKYVHDYMKLFGQVSEPNPLEFLRHSVHQMHLVSNMESHLLDHGDDHDPYHTTTFTGIIEGMEPMSQPPALPPKMRRLHIVQQTRQSLPASSHSVPFMDSNIDPSQQNFILDDNSLCRKSVEEKDEPEEVIIKDQSREIEKKKEIEKKEEEVEEEEEEGPLDLLDVRDYLILKKEGDETPDVRGGPVDSLIVHASKANKNDFLYQEAFLTTYRTFISPKDLVNKLLTRYNKFVSSPDVERQKAARNAFSLLVRVVDDLAITDLNNVILETLTTFEYTLLCRGELLLARALRRKIVEKLEARKRYYTPKENFNIASLAVTTKQSTLLDFRSREIAEQMTLLDAELFLTMEIPEVLLWASEQNEEKSPNLTTFTEHFNKMSYWARSRILEQEDSKDREKYVMKFISIMKHLRKINNFNSYLALLSALDSAPIRRLEWQRTITDGLKEYCALIDSSSSFRAYRQALSDSTPPCIPYIGLILQDLTFVNIGNNDLMPDGNVNFSKRWQQFHILDNMKRFKKCQYTFKKNEKIIAFFNNFEAYLNEEALWFISERIKPRGGKKK
ncbi:rap guanine nucleotide exchange factor 1-like isoform X2 [Homarus americanus]|uniref:rap guanine nucleotide exchange factor 1-like isoform X2 n=1 Tax=Homarus americanus TaxID=6706 RepID=UPI001C4812C2|nr:rap guanine nucleotide exchange factor 1-like isoform X2 [Homarus americanus]